MEKIVLRALCRLVLALVYQGANGVTGICVDQKDIDTIKVLAGE